MDRKPFVLCTFLVLPFVGFLDQAFATYEMQAIFLILHFCECLKMNLPKTMEELDDVRKGFEGISTEEVMFGCVGALDGYLLLIRTPSRKESTNVRQYFSGHNQQMGLNVQAMVDRNLRFMYASILKCGRSSDYKAYLKSRLFSWIENLPPWYFVVGGNAYVCTEHLLAPLWGAAITTQRMTLTFFLSQLRIRIEMAFGHLITKWRILCSSLEVPLKQCSIVFYACCHLHNYIISEEMESHGQPIDLAYKSQELVLGYFPSDIAIVPASGSILPQKIVQKIQSKYLSCLEINVWQRKFKLQPVSPFFHN